jgi:hypothetical protein
MGLSMNSNSYELCSPEFPRIHSGDGVEGILCNFASRIVLFFEMVDVNDFDLDSVDADGDPGGVPGGDADADGDADLGDADGDVPSCDAEFDLDSGDADGDVSISVPSCDADGDVPSLFDTISRYFRIKSAIYILKRRMSKLERLHRSSNASLSTSYKLFISSIGFITNPGLLFGSEYTFPISSKSSFKIRVLFC